MKKVSRKFIYKVLLASCIITTFSCRKVFDLPAKDQVDAENAYQNVYDANSAVIGIYGKFLGLADRFIVLNELRGDLMSPTVNADLNLKALNEHTETTDNPWADPKPWYAVILNINDAMSHFDSMLATGKLTASDYQQRYSDIGALRCFLYLQLGIQYGDQVRYVTDPLANITDLNDATKYPPIKFSDLLTKLLAFMNDPKRYMELYSTSNPVTNATNSSLQQTVDGTSTNLFFINKYVLRGDLNLWAGNYNAASVDYRYISDYGTRTGQTAASALLYEQYKVTNDIFTISYGAASSTLNPQKESESQFNDNASVGWRQIFAQLPTDSPTNGNGTYMWRIPYSNSFSPINPFINLFSNRGQGSYLLTASQVMIDNWNSQLQANGIPYDARGKIAVRVLDGQPVIMKNLYYYLDNNTFLPVNPLLKGGGYWLLYRSSLLGLHFAESTLNDNQPKLAYALLNVGISNMFNPYAPNGPPSGYDVTNTEQTFLPPPYDIDARTGGPQLYHLGWYRECGTRSQADLVPLPLSIINDKIGLENEILQEDARELSFEGYRYGDLVRIALRRGDPHFLADKVYAKLLRENNPNAATAYAKLLSPGGFYMPFKL